MITSFFKSFRKNYKRVVRRSCRGGIEQVRSYENYEDYVSYQKEKTTDPERVQKWLHDEWQSKLDGFAEVFSRNSSYVSAKANAICLGARTGQEVKALLDMGIPAIGVDLVPFEPYTVEGDIHDLHYADAEFDFVFTNIFDHSLKPDRFVSEMERVCRAGGVIMIHIQLGIDSDRYSETIVNEANSVINLFKSSVLAESRHIENTFDKMNHEIIMIKC